MCTLTKFKPVRDVVGRGFVGDVEQQCGQHNA